MRLDIFNPFSERYHSCREFKSLSACDKTKITIAVLFTSLITVWCMGMAGIAVFRTLVSRFKKINLNQSDIPVSNKVDIVRKRLLPLESKTTSPDIEKTPTKARAASSNNEEFDLDYETSAPEFEVITPETPDEEHLEGPFIEPSHEYIVDHFEESIDNLFSFSNEQDEYLYKTPKNEIKANSKEHGIYLSIVIQKIKKLAVEVEKEDKKLCVFIGKWNVDKLPQESNAIWISLDNIMNRKPLKKRLHLWMDLTQPKIVEKIHGLFDKVVVCQDYSLFVKHSDPWKVLSQLLKPKPTSELITQAYGSYMSKSKKDHDEKPFLTNGAVITYFEDRSDYLEKIRKAKSISRQKTQKYLHTLFKHVTFIDMSQNESMSDSNPYYVLRGPKSSTLN